MKTACSIILISIVTLFSCSCISRTTTTQDGYGGDKKNTQILWIWQKEYRNPE